MSPNDDRVELRIRPKAAEWARTKLNFEARAVDEPSQKQITVRMPAEEVAFLDALAKRFSVSRNTLIGVFLGAAASDAYAEIPRDERKEIVDEVAAAVGKRVNVRWTREVDVSEERRLGMPEDMIDEIIQRETSLPA